MRVTSRLGLLLVGAVVAMCSAAYVVGLWALVLVPVALKLVAASVLRVNDRLGADRGAHFDRRDRRALRVLAWFMAGFALLACVAVVM